MAVRILKKTTAAATRLKSANQKVICFLLLVSFLSLRVMTGSS